MNAQFMTRATLAVGCLMALALEGPLWAAVTNQTILAELPWAATYNREVDFMRSLLEETNRAFDEKVWRAVKTDVPRPGVVSYELISFTFSYPRGLPHAPSSAEMVRPDKLIFAKEGVSRGPPPTRFRPVPRLSVCVNFVTAA